LIRCLRSLEKSREVGGKLRFNRSAIVASDIAGQFYCEKKVEMQYLHGEVETEAKNMGIEAHEKLTEDSVKVEREQLLRKIYSDKPVFALEMFLLAKYGDALLAGKPDSVLFKDGFPRVLFEYKFSRSDVDERLHRVLLYQKDITAIIPFKLVFYEYETIMIINLLKKAKEFFWH
jgi:hypothetical protein